MRPTLKTVFAIILLLLTAGARADIAVIVHPGATVRAISLQEAANIFLGKIREMRDGTMLIPLDQRKNDKVKFAFYRKACGKSAAQLKAYWSRQVFTGQGEPPLSVNNDAAVKKLVSLNPNMIGYIDAELVDSTVKTVLLIRQ